MQGLGQSEQTQSQSKPDATAIALREGQEALKNATGPLFVNFWTDVLNMCFEWFPHQAGDRSENERAFQACRNRVLRVGNAKKREFGMLLNGFAVVKTGDVTIERHEMPTHGEFKLPLGVKMPPRKNG